MQKTLFLCLILMLMTVSISFAQYSPIFTQPYNISGSANTSVLDPVFGADYEVADNFSGLTAPITKFDFYGLCGVFASDYGWTPGVPNPTEPFKIKFYESDGGWTQPPELTTGIVAPTTGTYYVTLYDQSENGWEGGSLDVYVNGMIVLDSISQISGNFAEGFTFFASAGEHIVTVYTAGINPYESWYDITDPEGNMIAQDGDWSQTIVPTGIGEISDPPLVAATTGTYTINLYDTYGDSWNGASLDVYLNGIMVLDNLTLASGAGPQAYTFLANAGDVIATIFTPGDWPVENWYEILDPTSVQIAQDGPDTGGPTGIGFISTYVTYEPDWQNPLYNFEANAIITYIEPWDIWSLYKFEVVLPAAVSLSEGWISAQIDAVNGSGQWFLWLYGTGGDFLSYQRIAAKNNSLMSFATASKKDNKGIAELSRGELAHDMGFELYTDASTEIVIGDPVITPPPGVTVTDGGTIPPDLMGPDSGLPAVLYTIEATGTWDVRVNRPADWTTDWYCWINVGGNLIAGPNPIPAATLFHTFSGVDFGAKSPATVVINDNQTLPVELSSFAAVLTSNMFVNIAWVSQSETNHLGYNILRGLSDDAATAIKINDTVITDGEELGTQISYSYLDMEVSSGTTYWYWLDSVSLSGASQLFGPVSVMVNGDPDDPNTPELPPTATTLLPAFPNPFNPNTNIRYYLKEASGIKLDIYNTKGQLVRSFTNSHANPGYYQLGWDGRDMAGNPCSSGIYMYRLNAGKYSSSRRMVLAK